MGVGIFDMETRTAQILHLHQPRLEDGEAAALSYSWARSLTEGGEAAALSYSWARSLTAAPVWSPYGQWLAFTAEDQDPDESGVWVVWVGGQREEGDPPLFTEYHLGGHHPVWISDGRWLAFHRALPDGTMGAWAAQIGTWGVIRFALPPDAYIVDWMNPFGN